MTTLVIVKDRHSLSVKTPISSMSESIFWCCLLVYDQADQFQLEFQRLGMSPTTANVRFVNLDRRYEPGFGASPGRSKRRVHG